MDYFTLVLGSIFACFLLAKICIRGSKKLPPGPFRLPIIGNLHLLGAKPHASLARLAGIYGPIMSLKLGQITTVVISSSAVAREVLQKHDLSFANRLTPDAFRGHNYSNFSVPWLPVCPQWRTLRRILSSNIFSSSRLDANQHLRTQKVQELAAYCAKCSQEAKVVIVGQAAFKTSLNLLSNALFSKDLADPFSDSEVELKEVIWNVMLETGKPNLVDFFPILKTIDPQGIRRRMTIHMGKLFKLFQGLINERLEEKGRSGGETEKNDILEVFLSIIEKNTEDVNHNHINTLLLDIFFAGTETTTSTFEWAMSEILREPEIMKKIQAELADIIGKGKPVLESDISKLPYMMCIIKETLRLHPPIPLVPRTVEQDVDVCGFVVPKGSQVFINLWAIGRDSTSWDDPLVFKPERFLSSKIDLRGQDFELIPFGGGRRTCPGLTLAMRLLPVMLGSLLNSFNWKLEADIVPKELNMEEKFGLTLCRAHPLRAIPSPL